MKTHYKLIARSGFNYGIVGLFAMVILTFTSCKKNFEKYNTDNTGVSKFSSGLIFPGLQYSVFNEEGGYQLDQNLNADCYAGYMMSPNPFRGNINNLNYSLVDGWNQQIFIDSYTTSLFAINGIAKTGAKANLPDFWAIALILKVEIMDRVTDKFGPISYSKAATSILTTPYDSQQSVYNRFFMELDTATANLNTFIAANPGKTPFATYDRVFGGDYTKWLKFANSLRLRLAMHLTKVDLVTARAQGEKALIAPGGLMTTSDDNAGISGSGYHNPLNVITTGWTDIAAGASLQSYLVGYKDPRLAKYLSPVVTDPKVSGSLPASYAGQYIGIRIGSAVTAKPGYNSFSTLNPNTVVASGSPMLMMTAAEAWFLKAEAALRGWTGAGDVKTNYETGINTSLAQWGVSNAAYVNDAASKPSDYKDPVNSANNATAVSNITIAWNAGATDEQKLERIITQKWLAMFPEGQEAWTEFRRTGYPKLFTVVNNNSGGTIDTQTQIRRLAYPRDEYTKNGAEVQKAVTLLGGPDNGGTRVWWDVNKSNF
ncbi:SusD/RagB family nutrient-binding outer membrane lipoprotein [Mucilaginibacter sp. SG564]|uniref:SusD/RagB family nutrient-binding outer membrane lipoprotein n=1 Tax=Mucilaginibacter sp. SG564 TaxID=2587022 RepID=UPI0015529431|nr:SusD/RagB family nutrient-binding outer membrane lipoprotein [Mucilaginibacter sp. SG564]NOW95606.1 hypothetical protein [Mucilaginibacter sp. SG564]